MKLFLILALCSITIITVHAVVFTICDKCRLDLKTIVCTYLDSRYDNDENLSASMTQQDEDLKIEYTNKGIAFKNLSFSVRTRKKRELRILNEVTGWFNLGTSTALMGPSGSGKYFTSSSKRRMCHV
jgi:ABC-type transport system involved in cytochrome bd biosynthesis fused ATPase/permease subunit